MLSNGNTQGDMDSVCHISLSSGKKQSEIYFFLKGEKYDLNKRIFISISNRYVYVFRYVVRFYFSHKVSLTGSGMHYLNMGSETLVLHYMQTSVLRRELSKVEGGKH